MTSDRLSAIATVVSDLLVAASIVFAARQWKEAATQTRRAATAISAATYQGVNAQLQEIDLIFVDRPELRPHFYESSPAIRSYWSENRHWYRPELHDALALRTTSPPAHDREGAAPRPVTRRTAASRR